MVDQPWFLNTAIEVSTEAEPAALLEICLNIEKENHRTRQIFKGPRTLDMDILFYGSRIIHQPGLTIPHSSLAARRFVLAPLAEIAPDFVHPVTGQTIRELLQSCPDHSAVQIVGTL